MGDVQQAGPPRFGDIARIASGLGRPAERGERPDAADPLGARAGRPRQHNPHPDHPAREP